ncbi:MAG: NAD(P)/FAD-dependent oxidoreductase [Lachnospiraceae bacterium]|nr:NAD(P)/FAD-dependent oxidoreductase [Lachnospiraceae bacterium]
MKTIVIGGGPAGIMAAIASAYNGDNVILFEKNEKLGKKLFITGKGRCNVTNACTRDEFFENIVSNPKFLYSAFSSFDNNDVMRLIEDNGTPLKTERGNRVFPVSDHSSDIIKALTKALKDAGVEVRLNESIKNLLIEDIKEKTEDSNDISEKNSGKDKYKRQVKGIVTDSGKKEFADRVIICTGGISYKSTGSTGDGLHWAGESGHRIESLKPALVPLETKEKWVYNLQGLTLKNVKLSLIINEKTMYKEMGEMLFTHFGISGPLVLTASSILASYDSSSKKMVHIDLKPALSDEEFDQRLIRELKEGNKKEIKNIIGNIYPVKLGLELCKLIDLDIYKKCNEINKEERNKLVNITKRLPISISGTRDYNEAIITHGGVSVKDINPKSMESKIIKDLYFAGEVLDVDAFTGGFNLQIAFSTGYLAGSSNRY